MPLAFATLTKAGQTRRLKRLATLALAEYDVPVPDLTLLPNGWNTNCRVGKDHVLRVRPTSADFAEAETTWLTALAKDTALGVPEPVLTRTGEYVTTITTPDVPGPRTCVLYRWVPGRFHKTVTPADARKVGEFTAHLHNHGKTMPKLARDRVDDLPANAADLAALHSPEAAKLFERAITRITATQSALTSEGLIHADLHQDNFYPVEYHGSALPGGVRVQGSTFDSEQSCIRMLTFSDDLRLTFMVAGEANPDANCVKAMEVVEDALDVINGGKVARRSFADNSFGRLDSCELLSTPEVEAVLGSGRNKKPSATGHNCLHDDVALSFDVKRTSDGNPETIAGYPVNVDKISLFCTVRVDAGAESADIKAISINGPADDKTCDKARKIAEVVLPALPKA